MLTQTQTIKQIATRFYDCVNERDWTGLLEALAPDFLDRHPAPGQPPGPEGLVQLLQGFCSAFPDMTFEVEEMAVDGERVAVRFNCRGTHQGNFLNVSPTGRAVCVNMLDVLEVRDGKITAGDHYHDTLSFLVQIGAVELPQ